MADVPTIHDVRAAAERLEGEVHRTPVMTSQAIDAIVGMKLYFKCENLQRVGAFKFRGATNAVRSLADAEAARGVVTHSSGNHAQALALAAARRGIPAWVVMPTNAPAVKRRAVEGYGATVVPCEPTLAARESTADRVQAETGATFIHPYDDPRVIAGQGTAALELMADVLGLDAVVAPVGGGGLCSGTCIAVHGLNPNVAVYGAEPERANDAQRSLEAGHLIPVGAADTIADGLRTSLSERTFGILRAHVAGIVSVSEAEILHALRVVLERLKLVIEPSAAVPLAACARLHPALAGKRVGVILSGGNVDWDALPQLLASAT
ncbi:MAG: pyridoxal-phosphate dependent enzyme [Planctomycetota bacterium]|nr:pyridoxal-phosphate dependent enzyme [Planctomycetota bacterium]